MIIGKEMNVKILCAVDIAGRYSPISNYCSYGCDHIVGNRCRLKKILRMSDITEWLYFNSNYGLYERIDFCYFTFGNGG